MVRASCSRSACSTAAVSSKASTSLPNRRRLPNATETVKRPAESIITWTQPLAEDTWTSIAASSAAYRHQRTESADVATSCARPVSMISARSCTKAIRYPVNSEVSTLSTCRASDSSVCASARNGSSSRSTPLARKRAITEPSGEVALKFNRVRLSFRIPITAPPPGECLCDDQDCPARLQKVRSRSSAGPHRKLSTDHPGQAGRGRVSSTSGRCQDARR